MDQKPEKKVSLFKQNIKKARLTHKQQELSDVSFPKPIKIDYKQTTTQLHQFSQIEVDKKDEKQYKTDVMTNNNANEMQEEQQTFIEEMLKKQMKGDDMKQVREQNWKTVNNMSQQEIKKYQQMLMSEMPAGFLSKIMKNKSSFKMLATEKEQKQVLDPAKHQQQYGHTDNKMIDKRQQATGEVIKQQEKIQNEEQIISQIFILDCIGLNIKTKELEFQHHDSPAKSPDVHSISDIKTMLESENNQTQIVGCTLLKQTIHKLAQLRLNLPMAKISGVSIHYLVLIEEIMGHTIPSVVYHIKKTTFRSCWIQLCVCLIESIRMITDSMRQYWEWYGIIYINQVEQGWIKILQEIQKSGWLANRSQEQSSQNIYSGIEQLIEHMNKQKQQNGTVIIDVRDQTVNQLLQLLYIQQLQIGQSITKYKFQSTIAIIFKYPQTSINICFKIAIKFYQNQLKSNRTVTSDIKLLRLTLYQKIQKNYQSLNPNIKQYNFLLPSLPKLPEKLTKIQEYSVIQKLFIMKTYCYQLYIKYLNYSIKGQVVIQQSPAQQNQQDNIDGLIQGNITNQTIANVLTFINMYQYFATPQPYDSKSDFQKEVDNFQNMLQYLSREIEQLTQQSNVFKDLLPIIFCQFLVVFGSTEASNFDTDNILTYQSINQSILNDCMGKICQALCRLGLLAKVWTIITHQQVKTLLESYNFNSFGHYGFTRLLVFLLGASMHNEVSPSIENLILQETVCRYPFLFYYATENEEYYGHRQLYQTQGRRQWKQKQNILKTLQAGKSEQIAKSSNIFVKYLSCT